MRPGAWAAAIVAAALLAGCKSDDTQTVVPDERGQRGESCQARNDCVDGLACVANTCTQNEFAISVNARECFRIDCTETADCCINWAPLVDEVTCETYRTNCEAGDTVYCDVYNSNCICSWVCVNEQCVQPNTCETDADCASSSSVGVGVCIDGHCFDCNEDADCLQANAECVEHMCEIPCTRDEQCGYFESCEDGDCVERGCENDRECVFFFGLSGSTPQPRCVEDECRVPCENDAQCLSVDPFMVCDHGNCLFIGCTSDEQCRIYLGLQYETGPATAVCRAPEE